MPDQRRTRRSRAGGAAGITGTGPAAAAAFGSSSGAPIALTTIPPATARMLRRRFWCSQSWQLLQDSLSQCWLVSRTPCSAARTTAAMLRPRLSTRRRLQQRRVSGMPARSATYCSPFQPRLRRQLRAPGQMGMSPRCGLQRQACQEVQRWSQPIGRKSAAVGARAATGTGAGRGGAIAAGARHRQMVPQAVGSRSPLLHWPSRTASSCHPGKARLSGRCGSLAFFSVPSMLESTIV